MSQTMKRAAILAILKEHIACEPWSNVGCDLVGLKDAADALLAAMPKPAQPECHRGMSLRDYLAAKSIIAIAGLWKGNIGDFDNEAADRTAKAAYRMADAMLEARKS